MQQGFDNDDSTSTNNNDNDNNSLYANRHIPRLLELLEKQEENNDKKENDDNDDKKKTQQPSSTSGSGIQIIRDGSQLSAANLLMGSSSSSSDDKQASASSSNSSSNITLCRPIVVYDTPESIGMKVVKKTKQKGGKRKTTTSQQQQQQQSDSVSIRDIADIVGHGYPIHVIDVQHQEELEGWTLGDLVDYFEDEERLLMHAKLKKQQQEAAANATSQTTTTAAAATATTAEPPTRGRRRRKAAQKAMDTTLTRQRPRVLNQISLEFSNTNLRRQVTSPKFVRDLDWIDRAWPKERRIQWDYPRVQYYCLTSTAGCYTDFHIDFGGSSVWYHVLSGCKTFCMIKPTTANLKIYEDWLCLSNQSQVFLPDLILQEEPQKKQLEVITMTLQQSQTLVIPSGWIHAVYTPDDSVVVGGNFLHGCDISMQLQIHCIETRTRVQEKFRLPFFIPLQFYAGGRYLSKLQRGKYISPREFEGLPELIHALDGWWKVKSATEPAQYAATLTDCLTFDEFVIKFNAEMEKILQENNGSIPSLPYSHDEQDDTNNYEIDTAKQEFAPKSPNSAADVLPSASCTTKKIRISLNASSANNKPSTNKPTLSLKLSTAAASTTQKTTKNNDDDEYLPKEDEEDEKNKTEEKDKGDDNGFRIKVSSKSKRAHPTQRRRGQKKEDTEWYDSDGSDDWTPTATKKRRRNSTSNIPNAKTNPQPQAPPEPPKFQKPTVIPRCAKLQAGQIHNNHLSRQQSMGSTGSSNNNNNAKAKKQKMSGAKKRLLKRFSF